jgi:flagellar hook assembly protein FlgD
MATISPPNPTKDSTQPVLPGVARYTDPKSTPKPTNETMGKSEFLTLFTTQLQNQNPLDPVNNEAFVAQLAQFSQLEAFNEHEQVARRGLQGRQGRSTPMARH